MTIPSDESTPLKAQSLDALRRRLRGIVALEAENELQKFADALTDDPRQGAQSLVKSVVRRLAAAKDERDRVARLFALRHSLFEAGWQRIAGVDEVGVGPLAGPVVAAAVILPNDVELPGINDSKKLSRAAREKLDLAIRQQAVAISIGEVSHQEIDHLNIFQASLEAMRRAVAGLDPAPDYCLVDARTIPGVPGESPTYEQQALIHGDAIDGSVAAASIVAKVHRDHLMRELDTRYPGYGFARHMGYGTALHLEALQRLGASPVHRRSFAPVSAVATRTARP
ncbi:MAG: ribonuclease HII [Myxococcales bacterium]|nr:ribonuclease HII [Myxococcales bacterium]